jgi:hypothetical protein
MPKASCRFGGYEEERQPVVERLPLLSDPKATKSVRIEISRRVLVFQHTRGERRRRIEIRA